MILDEFIKTTGYHRKYAIGLLNSTRTHAKHPVRRPRRTAYGVEEPNSYIILTDKFNGMCSKLLQGAMHAELARLHQYGVLQASPTCCRKLVQVSPATIDHLLAGRRSQHRK